VKGERSQIATRGDTSPELPPKRHDLASLRAEAQQLGCFLKIALLFQLNVVNLVQPLLVIHSHCKEVPVRSSKVQEIFDEINLLLACGMR
jgi:hypothetical protein